MTEIKRSGKHREADLNRADPTRLGRKLAMVAEIHSNNEKKEEKASKILTYIPIPIIIGAIIGYLTFIPIWKMFVPGIIMTSSEPIWCGFAGAGAGLIIGFLYLNKRFSQKP